jgi:lysine decarboxylase
MTKHGVLVEVATASAIVAVIGAGVIPVAGRFLDALHALPDLGATTDPTTLRLPEPGPVALSPREAFLRPADVVPAPHAVGRIGADTLAAYPPGIPNLIPGELITADAVNFLQQVAASPTGHVRGAADPTVSTLRVVAD